MKRTLILLFLILFAAGFLGAQEPEMKDEPTAGTDADAAEEKKDEQDAEAEAEPLFAFDLNLAPNTTGALEGKAELDFLWSAWFYTGVSFAVSSFTTVYSENNGSTTSIESTKNLDIDVIKTRSNLLKLSFDDFYVALNAGLLLNIAWISQEKYGHGDTGTLYLFYTKHDIFTLYPFASGELELKLGPFLLDGYFRQSLFELYTSVQGELFFAPPSSSPIPFSTEDRGYETRFGGMAVFTPIPELEVRYGFDYRRHVGHTYGYAVVPVEFEYEAVEMKHTISLTFEIFDYRPMLGVSYVNYRFAPVSLSSIQSYSVDRVAFIFGLVYK